MALRGPGLGKRPGRYRDATGRARDITVRDAGRISTAINLISSEAKALRGRSNRRTIFGPQKPPKTVFHFAQTPAQRFEVGSTGNPVTGWDLSVGGNGSPPVIDTANRQVTYNDPTGLYPMYTLLRYPAIAEVGHKIRVVFDQPISSSAVILNVTHGTGAGSPNMSDGDTIAETAAINSRYAAGVTFNLGINFGFGGPVTLGPFNVYLVNP